MKERYLHRALLLSVLFQFIAFALYGQENKNVGRWTNPKTLSGDKLLGEINGCSNEFALLSDSVKQSIYTSPDRFLRFAFSLEKSQVNIFENTKCYQHIGFFKKFYQISETEFIIQSVDRFSMDPKDYFSKKIKTIKRTPKRENQERIEFIILEDNESTETIVEKISFHKIYWIYVGRKRRTLSLQEFEKDYGNKNVYISSIQVEFDNVSNKHSNNIIPVALSVNWSNKNLLINLTKKNTMIKREDQELVMYNWSIKEQKYTKTFPLQYECVRSIYR